MVKLVVFDWNATLIADVQATYEAELVVHEYLGMRKPTLKELKDVFSIPIKDSYIAMGLSSEKYEKNKAIINQLFYKKYEELSVNVRTRSGVREVFKWLKARKVKIIIVSNHYVSDIEKHLVRLGIRDYISDILAHHDSITAATEKNKEVRLKHYLQTYGIKSKESILIGDNLEEIEMGKNLGVTVVSITDGFTSTWRLRQAKPDYLIHNLLDLKKILINQSEEI